MEIKNIDELSQKTVDYMNEHEKDDHYKVKTAFSCKRTISYWERWKGWWCFLIADLICNLAVDIGKSFGMVGGLIGLVVAIAAFCIAGFAYYDWFDKILEKTLVVNLIEKESEDGKETEEGSSKVSESESNS